MNRYSSVKTFKETLCRKKINLDESEDLVSSDSVEVEPVFDLPKRVKLPMKLKKSLTTVD